VALWRAGVAPRILFSGGGPNRAAPEAAAMRAYALEAGVPADAIETEERSRSTLQNARFSADRLGGFPDRIVLVTDGFHLPRAWASFRWAGAREIDLVRAPGFDRVGWDGWRYHLQRETLAWWFNLARLGLVTALEAVGVPRSATDPLLA
jgi:uncharacterized SAM-binding protein YcdF (DUF218 family)